jgi:hypothetical protein
MNTATTTKTRERETRDVLETVELRAAAEGSSSPGTLHGYAAVYNRYSEDLGMFREKIAPGAFDQAAARCDVRALVNHDVNLLLGRTSAGTLRLIPDAAGLRVEVDLPDTTAGRDVAESVRRRDLVGQSFSFTILEDSWEFSGDVPIRTLEQIDELFDIGPVTFPAYTDTSAAVRAFAAQVEQRTAAAAEASAQLEAARAAEACRAARERDLARLRLLAIS